MWAMMLGWGWLKQRLARSSILVISPYLVVGQGVNLRHLDGVVVGRTGKGAGPTSSRWKRGDKQASFEAVIKRKAVSVELWGAGLYERVFGLGGLRKPRGLGVVLWYV